MKALRKLSLVLAFTASALGSAFGQGAQSFDEWLADFKQTASLAGISQQTISKALGGVMEDADVIKLDRTQPHTQMTYAEYKKKQVDPRIKKGREMMQQHAAILADIEKKYGVPPQYIVAFWGLETNYGSYTGNKDIFRSLATLAWDNKRTNTDFKKELLAALEMVDKGYADPGQMKGSWAGAMGQVQFMPTTYLKQSADGDGDGRADIWGNLHDAFASAANKMKEDGWDSSHTWGRRVKLPAGFTVPKEMKDSLAIVKTLDEWSKAGITQEDGSPLPAVPGMTAAVLAPDGVKGPAYLVYDNYWAIRKWNQSSYFILTVGELANAIAKP